MAKFSKEKQPSVIKEVLANKKTIQEADTSNFKVSFQYIDTSQKFGSTFKDWQKEGLLSKMMETLAGYCSRPLVEQIDKVKFTIYGDFPSQDKTMFKYPDHVPEDAKWGRIHITGPAVIAGHIIKDTFYVVFLDKTHKFYLTQLARGEK
ncbi:hypothetical protein LDB17_09855 [Dysgonomonas sp. Shenzhen-Wh21]|uniref:hypothetical protein n=1 Tax=Dysgonomonas TaxID=156973 RepID=UPI00208E5FD0|nr:hypothetical protein [Dysgonomonas mossii]